MDESTPLEEIKIWEHPPWYGLVQFKEIVTLTFLENQKGLFHNLKTHLRMPVKRYMIISPCRETSFSAITLNPSQTLLAERRIIPYFTKTHGCIQNYSYEFGCQAREAHRRLLEYRWIKRFVWSLDRFHSIYSIGRKTSRRIYVVRGEINKKTTDVQARSSMARTLEDNGRECQAEGEAKVVEWKAPSWKRTKIARNLFHRPRGYGIQRNHQKCA